MKKLVFCLWEKIRKDPLLSSLIVVFSLLLVLALAVMFSDPVEGCVSELLGVWGAEGVSTPEAEGVSTPEGTEVSKKYGVLKSLVIVMGGVILVIQAWIANKRAKAMENSAEAQANAAKANANATKEQAKANQNAERGQQQERLKNAIEHLGHTKVSVRLGGAYELFHLAEETKEWRQTILDILCAHIRQTTSEDNYWEDYPSKPSEEVQSLLTLLFVRSHTAFKDCRINLQGSWLNGADLQGAHLEKAILVEVRLQGAGLSGANLNGANLNGANLNGANLNGANLNGANLNGANLNGATLGNTSLQGASLWGARLQRASLVDASLQGASLVNVFLHEALIMRAALQGVSGQPPPGSGSFAESIRARIGQRTDLSGMIFKGGLNPGYVKSIVKDLPDEEAAKWRRLLEPHILLPARHELPENSGAITKPPYTAEEAEQWIAEYEKAMSEVPAESDN